MENGSIQAQQIADTGGDLFPEMEKMGYNHTQRIADTGGDLLPGIEENGP